MQSLHAHFITHYEIFSTDSAPPLLHILYGDLYIGGLPNNVIPKQGTVGSTKPFIGCIGDATLNGTVINFANSTDKYGDILGKCILDQSNSTDYDIYPRKCWNSDEKSAITGVCLFLAAKLPPLTELKPSAGVEHEEYTEAPYESCTFKHFSCDSLQRKVFWI